MKRIILNTVFALIMVVGVSFSSYAKNFNSVSEKSDSIKLIEQYSLFSEYHKNRDFKSALPYGWTVLEMDPKKFAKWIYYKMEETLWYLHDSSDVAPEMIESIQDTIEYLYELAIENFPEAKGYFQSRKGYVCEIWLEHPTEKVIAEYERAIEYDPEISSFYYHRLGQLYKSNADDDENDYKTKALEIYSYLSEREPDNPAWPSELESLVDNIEQLVELLKRAWDFDREDLSKAWKFAMTAIRANEHEQAIEALEFLVSRVPDNPSYLIQLAAAYQKTDKLTRAEDAYKKLIELEPDKREHYLNLGIIYKDRGQLSQARTMYQRASDVSGGWGLAIFYEGLLYEQAARGCEFNFETKLVYQLAVDTYRRARNMDASLTQAQERINALANSVPTQEDYFFRGHRSGTVLQITGSCFGWIGRSITVP